MYGPFHGIMVEMSKVPVQFYYRTPHNTHETMIYLALPVYLQTSFHFEMKTRYSTPMPFWHKGGRDGGVSPVQGSGPTRITPSFLRELLALKSLLTSVRPAHRGPEKSDLSHCPLSPSTGPAVGADTGNAVHVFYV